MSEETGGGVADCGDLANLSAQSKQCVSLWSDRIGLLGSPSRHTNKRTHTISESPDVPQNYHNVTKKKKKHTANTPERPNDNNTSMRTRILL